MGGLLPHTPVTTQLLISIAVYKLIAFSSALEPFSLFFCPFKTPLGGGLRITVSVVVIEWLLYYDVADVVNAFHSPNGALKMSQL